MKQVNLLILLIATMLVAFVSCEKDELSEKEAIQLINDLDDQETMTEDSLANSVVLTVTVVDASSNVVLKSANESNGLNKINVTASQGGHILVDSTDESGMVVFEDFRASSTPGATSRIALNVQGENYTSVDLIASIAGNGYYSVIIPVLSTLNENKGTIKGQVTFQGDLTDYDKEPAANATVFASLDNGSTFATNITGTPGIDQVVYSDLTDTADTNASGEYSIQLPADASGEIEYKVHVQDFVYDQTLLMNTVNGQNVVGEGNTAQTIATTFSSSLTSPTDISDVPAVDGVYATIEGAAKLVPAEATAHIKDDNSLSSVNVTTSGDGYEDGTYTLSVDNADQSASVSVHVENSQVAYVEVLSSGSNIYASNLNLNPVQDEFEGEVASVDGAGGITAITVDEPGRYLTKDVTVSANGGFGENITINSWDSNIDGHGLASWSFNIGNPGQNFEVGDEVSITVNNNTQAFANLNLSSGSVSSIEVTETGNGYAKNTSFEVELTGGGGQGAEGEAYTDAEGRVYKVQVTDGGSGYETYAPDVTFPQINEDIEVDDITFTDGLISGITFTNNEVYIQNPDVQFYNQATGNQISNLDFDIDVTGTTLVVDNFKHLSDDIGYTEGNYPTTEKPADGETSVQFINGGTSIHDIDLGTGKRSIED